MENLYYHDNYTISLLSLEKRFLLKIHIFIFDVHIFMCFPVISPMHLKINLVWLYIFLLLNLPEKIGVLNQFVKSLHQTFYDLN